MSFLKKLKQTFLQALGTASPKKSRKVTARRVKPKTSKKAGRKPAPAKKTALKPFKPSKSRPIAKRGKRAFKRPLKQKGRGKKGLLGPKAALKKKAPEIQGVLVGTISHFFPQVNAGAFKIESGTVEVGNELYFKGATTDFKMKITSLQINRVPVTVAGKGAEIGIQVKKRVRQGDRVYKLS